MASYRKLKQKDGTTSHRFEIARIVDGKQCRLSKCFPSKAEGQAWVGANEFKLTAKVRVTLHKALDRYAAEISILKRGAAAEQLRINCFKEQLTDCDLSAVTPDTLKAWVSKRLETVSTGSVRRDFVILAAFFAQCTHRFHVRFGLGWKYITKNPCSEVAKPADGKKRERIITDAELIRFIEGCESDEERNVANALGFAIETGLRRAELCSLDDTRIFEKYVVLHDGETKSNKGRIVPLSTKARTLIPANGFGLRPANFSHIFRRIARRVKLDVVFHSARHTAATRIGASGKVSPYELREWFGWSSIEQAQTYIKTDICRIADRF